MSGLPGQAHFSFFDRLTGLAVQSDGKIVVGGSACLATGHCDFALARYLPDGSLDDSFGLGGKVVTDVSGIDELADLAIQDDGKIVVFGTTLCPDTTCPPGTRFTVARYNPNGSLDTDFGTDGMVFMDPSFFPSVTAFGGVAGAVAVQPNGLIVVASTVCVQPVCTDDFFVARFLGDGAPDSSFSADGIEVTDISGPGSRDIAFSLALQPDGRILVGGSSSSGASNIVATIVRYLPTGAFDTSFGSAGVVLDPGLNGVSFNEVYGLVVQGDGKVVASGRFHADGQSCCQFGLSRYQVDGSLDATFGSGGHVGEDPFDGVALATDLLIQPDGKLVATGTFGSAFAAARYETEGALDASFGESGGAVVPELSGSGPVRGALQSDGRILIASRTDAPPAQPGDFAVARFLGSGDPPTFVSPPSPADGSTLTLVAQDTLTFDLEAADPDSSETVKLEDNGLPVGMNCSYDAPANPVQGTCSWTPVGTQLGSHTLEFRATDTGGLGATLRVGINVEQIDYVALGDSYSSGTGAGPYDFLTQPLPNGNGCRRSSNAYPRMFASAHSAFVDIGEAIILFGSPRGHVACHGALTVHVVEQSLNAEPPQVEALSAETDLVTMTIGGNDLDFQNILIRCAVGFGRFSCDRSRGLQRQVTARLQELNASLPSIYGALRGASRTARIFVLGYPLMLPDPDAPSAPPTCSFLGLNEGELRFLRETGKRLNQTIKDAVSSLRDQGDDRIFFVDVANAFVGHEVCTGADTWMNEIEIALLESFHPTALGHERLTECLEDAFFRDDLTCEAPDE